MPGATELTGAGPQASVVASHRAHCIRNDRNMRMHATDVPWNSTVLKVCAQFNVHRMRLMWDSYVRRETIKEPLVFLQTPEFGQLRMISAKANQSLK
jgi:hypothetical protein